jgi:hypothetical protein
LVGFDESDTVALSRACGFYDVSIEAAEDACSLFMPLHPHHRRQLPLPFRASTARVRRQVYPRPDGRQHVRERVFGHLRVVRRLGAQPVAVGEPEEPAQPQVRVRRDGAIMAG